MIPAVCVRDVARIELKGGARRGIGIPRGSRVTGSTNPDWSCDLGEPATQGLRHLGHPRGGELCRKDGVKHELAQMSNALTA